MIKKIINLLAICFLIWSVESVRIRNGVIYDEQGREIYFHGTNVVAKVPPYLPMTDVFDADFSFSEEDMANCKKWGFNAIRLGVMYFCCKLGGRV